MLNYILKFFGYLHINEIEDVLEEAAAHYEKTAPYNPYKPKSTAWWQQHYHFLEIAREIRWLKLSFKNKIKE